MKYTITFNETGLSKGTSWSVIVVPTSGAGTEKSSVSSTISFRVLNGTYNYSISPIQGYQLRVGSLTGTVTVGGSNSTIPVPWVAVSSPKSGLSRLDYVIIGVVVVAAALAGVILYLRHRNRGPPDGSPSPQNEATAGIAKGETPENGTEVPSGPGATPPGADGSVPSRGQN